MPSEEIAAATACTDAVTCAGHPQARAAPRQGQPPGAMIARYQPRRAATQSRRWIFSMLSSPNFRR